MSRIKIEYKGHSRCSVTLPPEIIHYITNKPTFSGRYIRFGLNTKEDINGNITGCYLAICNFYYDRNGSYEVGRNYSSNRTRTALKKDNVMSIWSKPISAKVKKHNDRLGICNTYKVDYKIFEDGDYYSIISYFSVKDTFEIPKNETNQFYNVISDVFPGFHHHAFTRNLNEESNLNEFYHFISLNSDNTVTYVTKDKFMDTVLKNNISVSRYNNVNPNVFQNVTRNISLSKLCTKLYPEHNSKVLQAHLEYTKMLSSYDESLFSIVSGNDILKYYSYNSYFKRSGDLGSSCMRNDNNQESLKFYANNSNVSLIIIKPKDVDAIIGRALLWTTTEGVKVMDRIYTSDSRLISLFHKYAEEKGFINVYNIRVSCDDKRNLMSMSPSYWHQDYIRNYIVDLQYLPKVFLDKNQYTRYACSTTSRRTSVGDSYLFPYIDNFNLINSETMQASLLPILDTFKCSLTDTIITKDNVEEFNGKLYNKHLVDVKFSGPVLKEDVITLDSPDTSVDIPLELPGDDDWNYEPEEEEELGWDELENIITEQITNQNNV